MTFSSARVPFGPLKLIAFKELINHISVPASNNIPSEESKQSKIQADKVALGTHKERKCSPNRQSMISYVQTPKAKA